MSKSNFIQNTIKLLPVLIFLLSLVIIYFLSNIPSFNFHLMVDVTGAFTRYSTNFYDYGSYKNLGFNEYQPTAMLLFAMLSPTINFLSQNPNLYINTLKLINLSLLLTIAATTVYITKKTTSLYLLSIIILISGPIIYFRFETIVCLFTLLSVGFAIKNKKYLSGVSLAIAILTKVYPIVLAPIFAVRQKKKLLGTGKYIVGGVLGGVTIIFVYSVLLQAGYARVFTDLKAHTAKPVHAESIWATISTLYYWILKGQNITGESTNGIYAIKREYDLFAPWFYNYAWVFGVSAVYIAILTKKVTKDIARLSYTTILIFVVLAKIITPQYLLWFVTIFPIIKVPTIKKFKIVYYSEIVLIVITGLLTQYIYPLKYTDLLYGFFTNGTHRELFYILTSRNIMLLVLLVLSLYQTIVNRNKR